MMGKALIRMGALLVILCMGCASGGAPPVYYGLQAEPTTNAPTVDRPLTIGVGPVQLPDYLDRSAIVTRLSPNRLQINQGHRWAGSLQSEILRVLAANLRAATAARQVAVFPWRTDFEPDLRFRISIEVFEGQPAQQVHLKATWTMTGGPSGVTDVLQNSDVFETIHGRGIEAITQAMGRALAVMSREMAAAVVSTDPSTQN